MSRTARQRPELAIASGLHEGVHREQKWRHVLVWKRELHATGPRGLREGGGNVELLAPVRVDKHEIAALDRDLAEMFQDAQGKLQVHKPTPIAPPSGVVLCGYVRPPRIALRHDLAKQTKHVRIAKTSTSRAITVRARGMIADVADAALRGLVEADGSVPTVLFEVVRGRRIHSQLRRRWYSSMVAPRSSLPIFLMTSPRDRLQRPLPERSHGPTQTSRTTWMKVTTNSRSCC